MTGFPQVSEELVRTLDRAVFLLMPVAVWLAAACSDSEAPAEDHTPATYNLIVNDVQQTAPYILPAGQSHVQVKLFNAAGEDLDDVEATHFAGLAFDPTSLATATRLSDHHFQFDVITTTAGSGTLQVSFGHSEDTDEKAFDSVAVSVTP